MPVSTRNHHMINRCFAIPGLGGNQLCGPLAVFVHMYRRAKGRSLLRATARLHESWNSLVSLVNRLIDLRSAIAHIGKRKGAGTSLLSNLAHIEMLHNNKMRITLIVMAAPLWTLICQSKSDYIQAIAQEIIKI